MMELQSTCKRVFQVLYRTQTHALKKQLIYFCEWSGSQRDAWPILFLDELPFQSLHHTAPRERNDRWVIHPGIIHIGKAVDLSAVASLLNGIKLLHPDFHRYPHQLPLGGNLHGNSFTELMLVFVQCCNGEKKQHEL